VLALPVKTVVIDGELVACDAEGMNLEGIVSKKRVAPYVAGGNSGWIKVKTREWREANRERYKLFEKA
jgi:ATP-dependent DNA ligase